MRRERLGRKAFFGVVVLSLAVALPGLAGADSNASINATVQIAVPLASTTSTLQLDFGHLKGDEAVLDGTVTVTPGSPPVRSATGGATLLGAKMLDDNFGPAEFAVSGEPGALYSIRFSSFPMATSDVGTPFLRVIALTPLTENFPAIGSGRLDGNGDDKVRVGGTVSVPARARPGKYVADIVLSFDY